MKARIVLTILLFAFSGLLADARRQSAVCKSPVEYGNRNKVEPKRSTVKGVSGRVITEAGNPAKELDSVPACIGLFTEKEHRLVASTVADEAGYFRFDSVPAGLYRLVVRDPQDLFCVANMPLRVVRGSRSSAKLLVIHMRPASIDDCSYGDFK